MSDDQMKVFIALLVILGLELATSQEVRDLASHPSQAKAPDVLPGVVAWVAGGLTLLAFADIAPKATVGISWALVALVAISRSDKVVQLVQSASASVQALSSGAALNQKSGVSGTSGATKK